MFIDLEIVSLLSAQILLIEENFTLDEYRNETDTGWEIYYLHLGFSHWKKIVNTQEEFRFHLGWWCHWLQEFFPRALLAFLLLVKMLDSNRVLK